MAKVSKVLHQDLAAWDARYSGPLSVRYARLRANHRELAKYRKLRAAVTEPRLTPMVIAIFLVIDALLIAAQWWAS